MLKASTRYDPVRNPDLSRGRRNVVMRQMIKQGLLDEAYYAAHKDSLTVTNFRSADVTDSFAPYFAEYVRNWLTAWGKKTGHDVYAEGLVVYTTLDSRLQTFAQAAVAEQAARQRARAEHLAMERGKEIVSLETAAEAALLEPSRTLVAMRDHNPVLVAEAIRRAKGNGDTALLIIAVTEWPGLFSGEQLKPDEQIIAAIDEAAQQVRDAGLTPIPIWRLSHNAARSIADAAVQLGADCVMLGVSQRNRLYHMLRGSVLKGLQSALPAEGVLIHTVG